MIRYFTVIFLLSAAALAQSSSSGGNVTVSGSPAVNDCAKFVSATVITTAGAACGSGGGGGVTSVTGTANQIDVATGTTTPVLTLSSTIVVPGTITSAAYATSGSNGGISAIEGTGAGLTPAAGTDLLYPDSTAHGWKMNNNNGTAVVVVGDTSTQTLTNKTLTTPTIASLTNAQHNHTNAAGGGLLTGAAMTAVTSGFFFPGTPFAAAATGSTPFATQNVVEGLRFIAPWTISIGHMTIQNQASCGSSTHIGFAIYSSDGTTQIATTGAQSGTNGVLVVTYAFSASLVAGTSYIFSWTTDSSTPTSCQMVGETFLTQSFINFTNTQTVQRLKGATASSGGTPPAGGMGALSGGTAAAQIPIVYFEQ